ncbi:hypothetical protein GIB67_006347 [Kingdonia uniflora]|uniref:Uncharacterized protein n=1 Tax=Kingdonia uniflora TaxID=39325 RepID=A0A7J7P0M0_9MAGN|nr:hypothetical protein GIB67_006347 [Kingdonia uniflora]
MAMAYASSMAVLGTSLPTLTKSSRSSATSISPYLPPRPSTLSISTSSKLFPESRRFASVQTRASSSEESSGSLEVGEVFEDLKGKVRSMLLIFFSKLVLPCFPSEICITPFKGELIQTENLTF